MRPSVAEIVGRRAALFERLGRGESTAFLATRPEDVRYLSGYAGDDAWLWLTRRGAWIVTDSRFAEEAGNTAAACEIVLRDNAPAPASPAGAVGALAKKQRVRRAGFHPGALTVAEFAKLRGASRGVSWLEAGGAADEIRAVKSPWEIGRIAAAQRIAERAFADWRGKLAPGATERELAAELDHLLRRHGAEGNAFATIVAVDANASLPHARPGNRKLRRGGSLLVDFGARVDGYCSDTTRTLFMGGPSRRWRERYELVLAAQAAALAALGPGDGGARAARAAAEVFAGRGVAELFGHGLGHGVGLAIHEPPRLLGARILTPPPALSKSRVKPAKPAKLSPGMVVTVEPGLYWPGSGGVRIEDMAVITAAGHRNLTHLPKALDECVLWKD